MSDLDLSKFYSDSMVPIVALGISGPVVIFAWVVGVRALVDVIEIKNQLPALVDQMPVMLNMAVQFQKAAEQFQSQKDLPAQINLSVRDLVATSLVVGSSGESLQNAGQSFINDLKNVAGDLGVQAGDVKKAADVIVGASNDLAVQAQDINQAAELIAKQANDIVGKSISTPAAIHDFAPVDSGHQPQDADDYVDIRQSFRTIYVEAFNKLKSFFAEYNVAPGSGNHRLFTRSGAYEYDDELKRLLKAQKITLEERAVLARVFAMDVRSRTIGRSNIDVNEMRRLRADFDKVFST
jgi:hypothetical protein